MEANEIKHEITEQSPVGLSPLVMAAMSGQLDTQKLADLLAIQKEYEANEARKAFHIALADFKRYPLTIYKDKHVNYPSKAGPLVDYYHATLGSALSEINPILGLCGLSLTWEIEQSEIGEVTVTAILTHAMGHCISTSLTAPPDESGGKNKIQAIGSTVEYLKRYTGFSLLGISSRDMDDDGRRAAAAVALITEEQVNELDAMILENGLNPDGTYLPKFLTWLGVDPDGGLGGIPSAKFGKAKKGLSDVIAKRKGDK